MIRKPLRNPVIYRKRKRSDEDNSYTGRFGEYADGSSDYYQEPASPIAKKVIGSVFVLLLLVAVFWFLWPYIEEALVYMK